MHTHDGDGDRATAQAAKVATAQAQAAAAEAKVAAAETEARAAAAEAEARAIPKAPAASSDAVRKSMQGNKRRDTKPELVVRSMLRDMGYPGYRLDWKKAPGHPDIAYPGRKTAVFVMGCFWHAHEGCKYASRPSTHTEYWDEKFHRNKQRDARVRAELDEMGWHVIEIWECELKKDKIDQTRERLEREIRYAFVEL